uniref:UDENN domain-containing protein n=1 Tax=Meloidogyne floridensis TaxID=298350 RepID=A0A915P5W6_9BILA
MSSDGSYIDSSHHFRIKRNGEINEDNEKRFDSFTQKLPPSLRPDKQYLYGFAYFRRQRDSSLHRGYSQKSIVLISHLPFVALFSRILSEVALAFFTAGESAIETACRQIGQHWPSPKAGGDRLLSLPLFGLRFCCSIPADLHKNESELDPGTNFIEQNGNQLPFNLKQQSLKDEDFSVWLIDLPLLVCAPNASLCSSIPSKRERSESRLVRQLKTQAAAQFVLGTLKRCGTTAKELTHLGIDVEEEDGDGEEWQRKLIKRLSDRSQLEKRSGGFFTSHKQFLAQDKTLTRRLLHSPSDSSSQFKILRKYFFELTQSFMSPLESYIATLMPLKREICPFQTVPQMRPFSLEQFLTSLKHFGHPGIKGDWQSLYRQFVTHSPNFIGWLRRRQTDIERQIRLEHMESICNSNFSSQILAERSQVEIVDLLMKLANRIVELNERKLKSKQRRNKNGEILDRLLSNSSTFSVSKQLERQHSQLQHQLQSILSSVDEELKVVLLSNPTFRNVSEKGKIE